MRGVEIRRRDACAVADRELHPDGRGTLSVPREVGRQPGERDAGGDKDAARDNVAAGVFDRYPFPRDQHDVPDDRDEAAQDAEDGAMLHRVRDVGHDEIHDSAQGETRHRQGLDLKGRPRWIQRFDDGRQKDGVGQ